MLLYDIENFPCKIKSCTCTQCKAVKNARKNRKNKKIMKRYLNKKRRKTFCKYINHYWA